MVLLTCPVCGDKQMPFERQSVNVWLCGGCGSTCSTDELTESNPDFRPTTRRR